MAVENNCKSIAFPLLATGTYRFPEEIGVAIAVEAFTEFLKEYEIEIFLVVSEVMRYGFPVFWWIKL